MTVKNSRFIFLLALTIQTALTMGVWKGAFCEMGLEVRDGGGGEIGRLAFNASLTKETPTKEKKEQPGTREEKKTALSPEREKAAAGEKGAPLKKFVPSEKIPADHAVDFPADI